MQIGDAEDVLLGINPYTIQLIDFSNNNFKRNDILFKDITIRRVKNRMSLNDNSLHVD